MGTIPPLLVGASAAAAAELSAGLLLFSEEGFLPALTLILTVETGALGLGLWAGPRRVRVGEVEGLRQAWLFTLVAFALASVFAAWLSFLEAGARGWVAQGLGLAILGALPLFSAGALLGAMARGGRSWTSHPGVAGPAVLGAALGFLLTGSFLFPVLAPYTVFLVCLVALSGGALLHGWVLDSLPSLALQEKRDSPEGGMRVEDWMRGTPSERVRVLVEGERLRGAETPEGGPGRVWESAVLGAVGGDLGALSRVVYLGGGSGTLARLLLQVHPGLEFQIVERNPSLVELARRHFLPWDGWDSVATRFGEPFPVLRSLPGVFPLVLLDVGVLPALGSLPVVGEEDWRSLQGAAGPQGVVVLGGLCSRGGGEDESLRFLRDEGLRWFATGNLFLSGGESGGCLLGYPEGEGREALLVFSAPGVVGTLPALPGFLRHAPAGA